MLKRAKTSRIQSHAYSNDFAHRNTRGTAGTAGTALVCERWWTARWTSGNGRPTARSREEKEETAANHRVTTRSPLRDYVHTNVPCFQMAFDTRQSFSYTSGLARQDFHLSDSSSAQRSNCRCVGRDLYNQFVSSLFDQISRLAMTV